MFLKPFKPIFIIFLVQMFNLRQYYEVIRTAENFKWELNSKVLKIT